jgi:FkbM family methyltransferase
VLELGHLKNNCPVWIKDLVRRVVYPQRHAYLLIQREYVRRCKNGVARDPRSSQEQTVRLPMREDWTVSVPIEAVQAYEAFAVHHYMMIKEMDSFIAATHGKRVLLDVGAYFGAFSAAFLRYSPEDSQIHSFEPSPEAYSMLKCIRDSVAHRPGQWTLVPMAVAAHTGSMELARDPSTSHLCPVQALAEHPTHVESLSSTSLDDYVSRQSLRPDLLKIDVEGGEAHVLAGASRILREYRPDLCIELHNDLLRRCGHVPEMLLKQLILLDYEVRRVDHPTKIARVADCVKEPVVHLFLHAGKR